MNDTLLRLIEGGDVLLAAASSGELLGQIKQQVDEMLDKLGPAVFRHFLPIADILVEAKEAYERETGTGHGKRNPAGVAPFVEFASDTLERSPSFVERLLRLAVLDAQTRSLIVGTPKLATNQDALLALTREPDPQRRHLAVEAFRSGGRAAMDRLLVTPLIEPFPYDFLVTEDMVEAMAQYQAGAESVEEPKGVQKRRTNAAEVFEYLAGGERKIDAAALERIGLKRAECTRALDDLRYSGIVVPDYLGDTFDIVEGKSITNLELKPPRKLMLDLSLTPGGPQRKKVKSGMYEFAVRIEGTTVQLTVRGV